MGFCLIFATLVFGAGAAGAALPGGWASADIGTVGSPGSAAYSDTAATFTIQGSGAGDIGASADNFYFVHRSLSGDGQIVARIASLTNTNAWAKAGVMIRETLAANSKHALLMVTPSNGVGIKWRATTAGSSSQVMAPGLAAPRWVKLERRGKMITGYESADGVAWQVVQRVALSMADEVHVGLAVCSRTSGLATATADGVFVDTLETELALPWPWTEHTVGAPADAGAALYDGGYVLSNLGADIAGTADKMKYVSQTLVGDGSLVVKVSSVASVDNSTRLCLMMRDGLAANARNVVLGLTTARSVVFMSRRVAGDTLASRATNVSVPMPAWLRLTRSGDVFTAWHSADGVNWIEHGSETLQVGPVLEVGLAYANRSASVWAIGIGDELKLTTPADQDGNGLPDAWEIHYFGSTGVDPSADPDLDGLTNGQEWELGNDPLVFNLEGQRPLLQAVGGDAQSGPAGTVLAQPLSVRVIDSLTEQPLPNIPVRFLVERGEGVFGSQLPGAASLSLFSDAAGLAQTPFLLPATGGRQSVSSGVGGRPQAGALSFALTSLVGPELFDVEPVGLHAAPPRIVYEDGRYTLSGATVTALTGVSDRVALAWTDLSGDGYVLARVEHLDAADPAAQIGVTMREGLAPGSRYVAMVLTRDNGVAFHWRETTGGSTKLTAHAGVSGPVWLLVRRGTHTFTGFSSADGVTWTLRGTRTQTMAATLQSGLVHGTRGQAYTSAAAEGLRLGALAESPWLAADIGAPSATAVNDHGADELLLRAGGSTIGGTTDTAHYVYRPLPADGRLTARLASHAAANSGAKTGLMIREGLGAKVRHLALLHSPASGVTLTARNSTNGSTVTLATAPDVSAPAWLRLERIGATLHARVSADGESWIHLGTHSLAFAGTPLVGLVGSSNDTASHSLAAYEHLRLQAGDGPLGWNAAYHDGASFGLHRLYRRDTDIDFAWPAGTAPAPGVSAEAYSVRWTADLVPAHDGDHVFALHSQGSSRLFVNNQLLIDRWAPHAEGDATATLALTAGQPVRVVVEYANADATTAAGRIRLRWTAPGQPEQAPPLDAVRPIDADDDGMPDAWEIAHGLDPHNPADAALDPDGDGLSNLQEYLLGGDPHAPDDRLPGLALMETWTGISGGTVRDLTKDAKFHNAPNLRGTLAALDAPINTANSYGRRVRGYLVPPATGDYRFHVSANDAAEFWLSPDDSPFTRVKIARVAQGTPAHRQFDAHPEQRSAPVALQAGQFYFFELLHKEGSADDHLTVAWSLPGSTAPEIISGSALALYTGHAADLDRNGLPDAWEAAHGLDDPALPASARGAYGDADNDRLPNLLEYQRGLDPLDADTDTDGYEDALEVLVQSDPLAPSDLDLAPWQLGDVGPVSRPALANRVGPDSFLLAGTGTGMAMHKEDNFRFLHREVSGDFELTARIARPAHHAVGLAGLAVRSGLGSKAINLTLLQSVHGQIAPFVRTAEGGPIVPLPAFTPAFAGDAAASSGYWFRARREGALVSLFYSPDGQRWILSNAKTLALGESCLVGFAICHNMGPFTSVPDVDLPVRLIKDIRLVTDLAAPADPEIVPPDATATPVATIHGNTGVAVNGQWSPDADGIVSLTFTGKLDYTFTVPADGLYRLTFTAASPSNPTTNTLFPLEISVDGQFVARVDLVLPVGEDGLARVVTPWLAAGTHTVRLFYDNTHSYRPLRIRSLLVEQLGGLDADADGRADWIEARIQVLNTLGAGDGELYVSPASLSGLARHRSLLALAADGQPVQVHPAPGFGWYADVALSETAPVEVVADFENSGRVQGALLAWRPLNLLALSPDDFPHPVLRIRKGDSLRLTAHPAGAADGAAFLTVSRAGASPVEHALADAVAQPRVHTFGEPGAYTLAATYTDGINPPLVADTFTVEVIEAAFASDPVVGLNNTPVLWDNPLIPGNVLLEVDHGLLLVKQADLPAGGTRFSLTSANVNESYVLARLGENGPVFGHATVRGVRVATVSDTAMDLLQTYPDGSQLIGVPIIVNHLTDDTRVEVEIFVQGVTFDDGTIVKVLTKADFDQYGRVYLKFVYPAGLAGSICHRVHLYEGQTYLGKF